MPIGILSEIQAAAIRFRRSQVKGRQAFQPEIPTRTIRVVDDGSAIVRFDKKNASSAESIMAIATFLHRQHRHVHPRESCTAEQRFRPFGTQVQRCHRQHVCHHRHQPSRDSVCSHREDFTNPGRLRPQVGRLGKPERGNAEALTKQ